MPRRKNRREPILFNEDFIAKYNGDLNEMWKGIPEIEGFKFYGFRFTRTWGGTTVSNYRTRMTLGLYYMKTPIGKLKREDAYILCEYEKEEGYGDGHV